MNPFSPEVSAVTITSTLHSLRALGSTTLRGSLAGSRLPKASHALPLVVPSEITDPATAAGAALALCQSRWDEVTLALYLDNQYKLVGHSVVATGWVEAALLSARPVLAGSESCQATKCVLVRYRPYGVPCASEAEDRSFRTVAAACARHGLAVVDHLVVVGNGTFTSIFLGGP
jgi:DNA repair protein RadC